MLPELRLRRSLALRRSLVFAAHVQSNSVPAPWALDALPAGERGCRECGSAKEGWEGAGAVGSPRKADRESRHQPRGAGAGGSSKGKSQWRTWRRQRGRRSAWDGGSSALRSQGVAPSGERAAGATSASRPTARGPPRLGVRSREAGLASPLPLHSWPWDALRLVPGARARMPSSSWAGTSGMA